MDLMLDALTREERTSLTLALEFLTRFTRRDVPTFVDMNKTKKTFVRPSEAELNKPRVQKFRASVATKLYADNLPKDVVDRAVYAVVSGMATRHDVNRLIANALRTAESNEKTHKGPTTAWLVFWGTLKSLYESADVEFPTMSKELEPVPDEIISRREAAERLQARVQATK